jgi:signal transduction histidine kinase
LSGLIHPPQAWAGSATAANRYIAVTVAIVFYYVFAYLAGTLADQLKAVNQNLRNAQSEIEKHSRLLEEKVRTRTRELQNRNSEIEEFVHIVTHDLKNVSVGAIETARILLSREAGNLNERARRYLQHLLEDTTQMNAMLVQLLELFRVDERESENRLVDLGGVAADLVKGFKNRIESKALHVTVNRLPEVVVDETQLRHVLGNLLDNAIKYTPSKSPCTIAVESEFSDEEWIIAVKDGGIGIAANQIDRIFQLYFRGSNVNTAGLRDDGDGVGLAICKRIVERWGGRIWVESVLGKGSIFRFSIPRIAKAA